MTYDNTDTNADGAIDAPVDNDSVSTESSVITPPGEVNADEGITDKPQLSIRGNEGSALAANFRGTTGSGTDKAALGWWHDSYDHILAKIVAHATDNHWSLYTTPFAADQDKSGDNDQFRKRLDVYGGDDRTNVIWRNINQVQYRANEHPDSGEGDFDIQLRRPGTSSDATLSFTDVNGSEKFSAGFNEFDQFAIVDETQPLTVFRMDIGEDRPIFDEGFKSFGPSLVESETVQNQLAILGGTPSQTVTNGSSHKVKYDAAEKEDSQIYSVDAANDEITVLKDGVYSITASVRWEPFGSEDYRGEIRIDKNGTDLLKFDTSADISDVRTFTWNVPSNPVELFANDTLSVVVEQEDPSASDETIRSEISETASFRVLRHG